MGTRKIKQPPLFLMADDLPVAPTTPFFHKLAQVLEQLGFDEFVERTCAPFYIAGQGRPSLPPGVYFRMLLGYLMGCDSERRIALQACDSLSLRAFLGYELHESTPDHSTLARTRQRISLEAHVAVFEWVLEQLRAAGLARGQQIAVDATTLQANAALQSLRRKDSGASYLGFVKGLARAAGESVDSIEELLLFDQKRKGKTLSNEEWESPADPDARVAKMKGGTTDLAYKAEHAVDLDSGALVAVTVQKADLGDPQSLPKTLAAVEAAQGQAPQKVVLDKGYHSDATLERVAATGAESYVPEPQRQQRNWKGKPAAQQRYEQNQERAASLQGKALAKLRTEKAERSMAHMYETGRLRRVWLRGRANVEKRVLIHACGHNLGVLMRSLTGIGTPRSLQGSGARLAAVLLSALKTAISRNSGPFPGLEARLLRNSREIHSVAA